MAKKESIKIRLSTAILVIIILVLIALMAYVILVGKPDLQKLIGRESTVSAEAPTPTPTDTPTPETTTPTPEASASDKINLIYFDPNKVVNAEKNIEYSAFVTESFESDGLGISLEINDENQVEVIVTDSYKSGNSPYGLKKGMKRKLNQKEIVTGLTGEVKDIVYGGFGQDFSSTSSMFFLMMEDGTVQYITVEDLLKSETIKPTGTVSGLTNIVKIQEVEATEMVDETGGPGWVTIVAIDNKGNAYDIGEILNLN